MQLRQGLLGGLGVLLALAGLTVPANAGMIGYPAARLQALHLRFEIAVDSFEEDLQNTGSATATTGRALTTVSLGLTDWSEVFARLGVAEFNIDEAIFNGEFGLAYGGGVRLQIFTVPLGSFGLTGQYLRFTSDDDDSAGTRVDGEWQEVDVAVGFGTRRLGHFAFYGGVALHYSDITLDAQETSERTTLDTDIPFRLLIGAHIFPLRDIPGDQFLLNLEARLIGETPQFTLGVQYAF
ncbi:hypothetical protein NKDENANG_02933 [Candidatus Entotheonellaceae bacterium PAL068K]